MLWQICLTNKPLFLVLTQRTAAAGLSQKTPRPGAY